MDAMVNSRPFPLHCISAGADHFFTDRLDAPAYEQPSATPISPLAEDGEFYIPDLLRDDDYEPRPGLYAAAEAHAWRLRKAERHLDRALNLSQLLRAAMGDAGDSRAMQVDTVLKIVEKAICRAHSQIDRHEASHVNLFMAYVDLRDGSDRQ